MSTSSLHPHGVFSAALTPLDAELAPDHARFVDHCRYLLDEGCDGIAMLGTTGEANSFSVAERTALLEAVVAAGIAPRRLLPGTGVAALSDTIALTRHALSVGVNTVVMLPPFYYKNVTDDGIYASYSEVVQRIGDARLKVVLYHYPQMSAQPISHALMDEYEAFRRAARPRVGLGYLPPRRFATPTVEPRVGDQVALDGRRRYLRVADEIVELNGSGPARQITLYEHGRVAYDPDQRPSEPQQHLAHVLRCRWCIENTFIPSRTITACTGSATTT